MQVHVYLFRALHGNEKRKILLESKQAYEPAGYNCEQVDKQFRRAVITGFAPRNEGLKMGLENVLDDYDSEDELISELNEVTLRHSDRLDTFKSRTSRGQSQTAVRKGLQRRTYL